MDNFIDDDFADEYSEYQSGHYYKNGLDSVVFADTGTIAKTINTLSDLFVEWYLFDSTNEKTIKSFLSDEGLADIFTETQYMDLMCGNARMDDVLLPYIWHKLPFSITLEKLHKINYKSLKKYTVLVNEDVFRQKMAEILETKEQKKKLDAHEYYIKNREWILERNKKWRERNPEKVAKYATEWNKKNPEYRQNLSLKRYREQKDNWVRYYNENRERILAYQRVYRELNSEKIAQRINKWKENNAEHVRQWAIENHKKNREKNNERSRKYYAEHKEKQKEYMKKWREKNPDYAKEYRKKNPEKIAEYSRNQYRKDPEKCKEKMREYRKKNPEKMREYYLRKVEKNGKIVNRDLQKMNERNRLYKADKQLAKQICPVFQFLESVRTKKLEQYVLYFAKGEVVATKAKRDCVALQMGDNSLCPICAGNMNLEQMCVACPVDRAFKLENACAEINKIVAMMKAR